MEWIAAYFIALALHEAGHLVAGLLMGMRPYRIHYLLPANGFAVVRWRAGATTVVLGWLPLGAGIQWEGQGQPAPPQSRSRGWEQLNRWQQCVVLGAGIAANTMAVAAGCVAAGGWPQTGFLHAWVMVNVVLAALQLLPSRGTDAWWLARVISGRSTGARG